MKKYYAILSSLITAVVIYVSVMLDMKVKEYIANTFDSKKGFLMIALILFVVGIVVASNIWLLLKSNIVSVIVSIFIGVILQVAMFHFLRNGFLYPATIIGAYAFVLIKKLVCKKNK